MKTFFKILVRVLFLSIAIPLTLIGFFVATVVRGVRSGSSLLDDLVKYLR